MTMNPDKVVKALEQAQRDRGLRGPVPSVAWAPRVIRPELDAPPPIHSRPAYSPAPGPSPRVRPVRSGSGAIDAHLVSLLSPLSFGAEQYRTLRYVVEQAHRLEQLSIVAVSAPALGDGKTTTAINLAGALAQSTEARVVLIDADLRRPSLHRYLGLGEVRRGLTDAVLDPTLTLVDVVQPFSSFNLSVVPAGSPTPSPYELLKSERFGELLEEARRQYDYVIVDTPPLVQVPDCRIIGKHVDGFLLVVRAHKTRTKLFDEAVRVLESSKVLGVVFNGSDDLALVGYANNGPAGGTAAKGDVWRRRVASDGGGFFGGRRNKGGRYSGSD